MSVKTVEGFIMPTMLFFDVCCPRPKYRHYFVWDLRSQTK